jgi:hypothetical protein
MAQRPILFRESRSEVGTPEGDPERPGPAVERNLLVGRRKAAVERVLHYVSGHHELDQIVRASCF